MEKRPVMAQALVPAKKSRWFQILLWVLFGAVLLLLIRELKKLFGGALS